MCLVRADWEMFICSDGSGYVATYRVRLPHITAEMERWYRNWRNLKSKSMVPGHHLVLRFSRPCPLGGRESINCEWMGWYPKGGRIVRDPDTPVDEGYLKNVITHNTIERAHLLQVLPDLYEAYKDLPIDED